MIFQLSFYLNEKYIKMSVMKVDEYFFLKHLCLLLYYFRGKSSYFDGINDLNDLKRGDNCSAHFLKKLWSSRVCVCECT